MVKALTFNPLETNCYLIADNDGAVAVVDPGCYSDKEASTLEEALDGLRPEAILLTHGHPDHVYGVARLARKYGIPVMLSAEDNYIMERCGTLASMFGLHDVDLGFTTVPISDGSIVKVGGLELRALSTPGHTPGGISWYCASEKVVFSGDTLVAGSIGRTDMPGGDYDVLMDSLLKKIMVLPEDTLVLPGHGPETTIGREAATNPFLEPFNEPLRDGFDDIEPIALDGLK